ncbi:MAG: regulatory protein RecX [Gammaproteobacteria bacterium]
MDLLARREHSVGELRVKLRAKGFDDEPAVEQELARLCTEGLLSDARFAEAFVHAHRLRGQGPLRVAAGLRERSVPAELIEACVDQGDEAWCGLAQAARSKRFGGGIPQEFDERARQARFLRYRGFTEVQVRSALRGDDDL